MRIFPMVREFFYKFSTKMVLLNVKMTFSKIMITIKNTVNYIIIFFYNSNFYDTVKTKMTLAL